MKTLNEDQTGTSAVKARRAVPHKWQWHYHTLCRLRSALLAQRCRLVQDSKETLERTSKEPADSATDEFHRELALAELSHNQDALYEIDEALSRLESGTYGICELTGKPIPAARLRAVPSTRFTRDSEYKLERNGAVPLVRLGERRSLREIEPERGNGKNR